MQLTLTMCIATWNKIIQKIKSEYAIFSDQQAYMYTVCYIHANNERHNTQHRFFYTHTASNSSATMQLLHGEYRAEV